MTRWSKLFLVVLAACKSSLAAPDPTPKPNGDSPRDKDSQLITDQLRKMNGAAFGRPSSTFRAGSVSARKAPEVKRTKNGYEIKFGNGSAVSTPAVYDGKLYTSGGFNSREMYAFEAKSGKPAFALDLSDDGPSAIACEDNTCVFNTESCTIFAIDAATGKQRWSWFLGDPQTSSPTIARGRVFTTYPAGAVIGGKPKPDAASHVLAAFDLATGKVLWQEWLDADVISAPVAVDEFLYVATYSGTIIKLEQATGKIRYATKAHATSAPVVEIAGGLESMYYTRRADQMPSNGSANPAKDRRAREQMVRTDHNEPVEKWSTEGKRADYLDDAVQDRSEYKAKAKKSDAGNGFAAGAPSSAAPHKANAQVGQSNVASIQQFQGSRILHLKALNVNTMGDEVVATDPDNGKQRWSYKLEGNVAKDGGFLGAPPIAAGNHVVVATLHGKVLEIDPSSGKVEHSYDVGGALRSQPVAHDGWIFVGTDDGRLIAVDTGDRTVTGWSMWGGNAQRTGSR